MTQDITTERAAELIDDGGIANALAAISPHRIIDPELRALWAEADVALSRIEDFVNLRLERV